MLKAFREGLAHREHETGQNHHSPRNVKNSRSDGFLASHSALQEEVDRLRALHEGTVVAASWRDRVADFLNGIALSSALPYLIAPPLAVRAATLGQAAKAATEEAFHYTFSRAVSSIERQGLRAGSYATPNGALSPLQAQIDVALAPNRGLPGALLRVDLAGLRQAGYQIPEATQVGRSFGMPGGGFEMQFPYPIPPQFIRVIRP